LREKKRVEPADLEGETILKTEAGCSYRDLFDRRLKEGGLRSPASIEFWNIEAIKNCVMCGLGIAYMPRMAVTAELEEGKLIALPWSYPEDRVVTQLVRHKNKWMTPAMEKLMEIVRRHAAEW